MQTILNFFKKIFSTNNQASSDNKTGLIIAAQVTKIEPHPNADRLIVVELFDGNQTHYPVVCGAKNFAVNDIVVLALPGANIKQNIHSDSHEPFVLQTAKIRGIESQGMICASFELGESQTPEEGIKILPKDTKPGTILY
ncbi:MAG: hypothetical protein R3B41_02880 [Candidatus Doudnabacteria bacterium]